MQTVSLHHYMCRKHYTMFLCGKVSLVPFSKTEGEESLAAFANKGVDFQYINLAYQSDCKMK